MREMKIEWVRTVSRIIFAILSFIMMVGLISCDDQLDKITPSTDNDSTQEPSTSIKDIHAELYTIAEGQHSCDKSAFVTEDFDTLAFNAKFDSSAIYKTTLANNQADINKLYGLSDCGSLHQVNSARFGWRWYNNHLEIWAYTYNDSVRDYKLVGTVSFNEFNSYKIIFAEEKYIFLLNDKRIEMPRHCSETARGYKLYPYFGGDETAPHSIRIWISDSHGQ
jgi:hypothetical protein